MVAIGPIVQDTVTSGDLIRPPWYDDLIASLNRGHKDTAGKTHLRQR